MLEVEHIGVISDEMREVVQSEWPELAPKLPPRTPRGWVKESPGRAGALGADWRNVPRLSKAPNAQGSRGGAMTMDACSACSTMYSPNLWRASQAAV